MTSNLRAGLVGLGRMGRNHARVLRHLDDVTLAGAADPAGDPYQAADGVPVYGSIEDLIAAGIDYAVLACPTSLHEPLGTRLAAAGIPTLIEKPLAPDSAAARRLAAAFSSAGVPATVGYIERCNPALIAIRDRLAAGHLGQVFQVATRRTGPFPARITDVGVVHDLATHDLDLTAWVTGQRYARVSARTLGCLAADTLTADLTYWANGAEPTQWDALAAFRGVTEGDMIRYAIPKKEPLLAEHEAWRDAVLGRPASITPVDHGIRAILVAEAMIESSSTGTTMPVSSPAPAR
jgi:predicted dehydrogenase